MWIFQTRMKQVRYPPNYSFRTSFPFEVVTMDQQLELPSICVQDSINEVLADAKLPDAKPEEFWVEINGKELRFLAIGNPDTEQLISPGNPAFTAGIDRTDKDQLHVRESQSNICHILLGKKRRSLSKYQLIRTGDIYGSRVLMGNSKGNLVVVDATEENFEQDLEGHALYTSLCRFFPSGSVALSAGMDYTIKIWDLQSGSKVQSMVHQKGVVNDVALIGRGRTLLSLSQADESVALWEVSRPTVISYYKVPEAQCLELWDSSNASGAAEEECCRYGTDGKAALIGATNTTMSIDLRSPNTHTVFEEGSDTVSLTQNMLVRSFHNTVYGHDIRMPHTTLFTISQPRSEHHDQTVYQTLARENHLFIRTGYASFRYSYDSGRIDVLGNDNGLLVSSTNVWSLGRDLRQFRC